VVDEVLAEHGFDGLTFEEVARRAGASKATLYRRWSSKGEMVVAALKAGPARHVEADDVDTGTLRGDLLALCKRLAATMQSSDGRTALVLLKAGLEDPGLCEEIERAVGPTGARLPASVMQAAIGRGELSATAEPFAYEEVVGSVVLLRRLKGLTLNDAYLAALVDAVLIPALTMPTPQPAPGGIFSGHPTPHVVATDEGE